MPAVLTVDIGNSHTVLGWYPGDSLERHWRLRSDPARTPDETRWLLSRILSEVPTARAGAIISSVVPDLTGSWTQALGSELGTAPLEVGSQLKTNLVIGLDSPGELGADRICNAVAAIVRYGTPAVVVDFGTATTFDVISSEGVYLGGAIAPGVVTSTEALFARAAKLSSVSLRPPERALGRNTEEGLLSGIVFGFAGQVDGLLERLRAELAKEPALVATGGIAPLIAPLTRHRLQLDPFLTLDGLYRLYRLNT